jgi:hypothetical protein
MWWSALQTPGALVSVTGAAFESAQAGGLRYPVIARMARFQSPFEAAAGVMSLSLESASGLWTLPLTVKRKARGRFLLMRMGPRCYLIRNPAS